MDATGNIYFPGGDCVDLPGIGNDNDLRGTVTANARTVEIVDINDLKIAGIMAESGIRLAAGDGEVSPALVAQTGRLVLHGNLVTSAVVGKVLLQSDLAVRQGANYRIQTQDLILQTARDAYSPAGRWAFFELPGANQVQRVAGDIGMDGQSLQDSIYQDLYGDVNLWLKNTIDLQIAALTFNSQNGSSVSICGLDVDGNLRIGVTGTNETAPPNDTFGDLTQASDAAIRVTGDSYLDATGNIYFPGGDCVDLPGIGNDNDLRGTVTANARTVVIVNGSI